MFGPLPASWRSVLPASALSALDDIASRLPPGSFYPSAPQVMRAFNEMPPFPSVKVVILGHDPYTRNGQADGLAFSVPIATKHPHSLRCIFKEVERNGGRWVPPSGSGDLTRWATQGVLLLNTILTVARNGPPGTHSRVGWETFTNECLRVLGAQEGLVFMVWGNRARSKRAYITSDDHLVLESGHPAAGSSPAPRFKSSCPFRRANAYLAKRGTNVSW
jgi:uracil-DNA glycosylase